MAIFHFHATQIKRSAGQSAIASAAYRAGENLYSEYYGEYSDYTHKGGVIHLEIILPSHAPPEYADRQTLWNAVENAERGKKAQLAYSFDIALQNEFSMDENIELARQFLSEQFVSRGMIVDFSVHAPDKDDGSISNPHFHVMCPIRPLKPNGEWDAKQHRVYALDEGGNRIRDGDSAFVFNAVSTTDWGQPETLEAWRTAWAELCNTKFADKGLSCRIDNRSYVRQGVEQLPTVHEGPAVRQMERRGERTDKGDLNRWIKATNALIREAKKKIATLLSALATLKASFTQPKEPTLIDLLNKDLSGRNAGAWSNKAKAANLKKYAATFELLSANKLTTMDELMAYIRALNKKLDKFKATSKAKSEPMKELNTLLRMADYYADGKPVFDKLSTIKFKKSREAFQQENDETLRRFYMAQRKLKPHFSSDGKLPITKWRKDLAELEKEYAAAQSEMKPIYAEVQQLYSIRYAAERALDRQNAKAKKDEREL